MNDDDGTSKDTLLSIVMRSSLHCCGVSQVVLFVLVTIRCGGEVEVVPGPDLVFAAANIWI